MYFWVPHLPFKDGGVGARAPSVSSHNHCNKLSERGFNMFVVQRERYKVSDSHSFQEGKKKKIKQFHNVNEMIRLHKLSGGGRF